MVAKRIYLIGSLRNHKVPELANVLRDKGYEVFDDWHSPGPETDDFWQKYEKARGRSFKEALDGEHAWNVFNFDKLHLDRSDTVVMVMPAGKSGHLEFGYCVGRGKQTIIYLDKEPERFDVMYRFADQVVMGEEELLNALVP